MIARDLLQIAPAERAPGAARPAGGPAPQAPSAERADGASLSQEAMEPEADEPMPLVAGMREAYEEPSPGGKMLELMQLSLRTREEAGGSPVVEELTRLVRQTFAA